MAQNNRSRVRGSSIRDILSVASNPDLQSLSVPYLEQCAGLVRESFVFSILTVNEQTARAEAALWAWRMAGMPEDAADIRLVCGQFSPLAGTSNGLWNKAVCIEQFLQRYNANPGLFEPRRGESASDYRDRVLDSKVNGLALTKTTWACQLAIGGGNIACLDRHMMYLMLGRKPTHGELNTNRRSTIALYRHLEDVLVWIANRYGWHSASALQWSAWATALKENVTHDVIYKQIISPNRLTGNGGTACNLLAAA